MSTQIRTTTCYMCACRCGIRVHLKDGAVRYIDGNPEHPINKGVICAKGASGIMKQNSPARLTRPLRHKSSLQTAIGIKHPKIAQKAQGAMGGSFNTREFFQGRKSEVVRAVMMGFLIAERWYFFAEAKHPQNLYYQSMS
jgi:NADH dehydrogenase/NADH:ubiquinone oxidoreductase subunit G